LAMRASERVERIAVLAVGHPGALAELSLPQLRRSWYMFMFQLPLAEEWLRADDHRLLREILGESPDLDVYLTDLERPGALAAGLAWYRANRVWPGRGGRDYPPIQAPVMGLWADGDSFLAEQQMVASGRFVAARWRYERLTGAAHWMQLDQPDVVNALLLDFLSTG